MSTAFPKVYEEKTPGRAIRKVQLGMAHACVVRKYLDADEAEKQAEAIVSSPAYKPREDGVPGGTLGPTLFEKTPVDYVNECALARAEILHALGREPDELYAALREFENLTGVKTRPVVFGGKPAAYNRALVFPAGKKTVIQAHEDLSNVRALADYGFEISEIDEVLGHNLYLRNMPGQGNLVMYGKKFSEDEKKEISKEVYETGYPYPEELFHGVPKTVLEIGVGDYVCFRADYPHAVVNNSEVETDQLRVSWNGFLAMVGDHLVYWT